MLKCWGSGPKFLIILQNFQVLFSWKRPCTAIYNKSGRGWPLHAFIFLCQQHLGQNWALTAKPNFPNKPAAPGRGSGCTIIHWFIERGTVWCKRESRVQNRTNNQRTQTIYSNTKHFTRITIEPYKASKNIGPTKTRKNDEEKTQKKHTVTWHIDIQKAFGYILIIDYIYANKSRLKIIRERPGPKKKWSANCRLKLLKTPIIASLCPLKLASDISNGDIFFFLASAAQEVQILAARRRAHARGWQIGQSSQENCSGLAMAEIYRQLQKQLVPSLTFKTRKFRYYMDWNLSVKVCLPKNFQQQNYKRFFRTQEQCAINKIYLCTVNIFEITCAFSSKPLRFCRIEWLSIRLQNGRAQTTMAFLEQRFMNLHVEWIRIRNPVRRKGISMLEKYGFVETLGGHRGR